MAEKKIGWGFSILGECSLNKFGGYLNQVCWSVRTRLRDVHSRHDAPVKPAGMFHKSILFHVSIRERAHRIFFFIKERGAEETPTLPPNQWGFPRGIGEIQGFKTSVIQMHCKVTVSKAYM